MKRVGFVLLTFLAFYLVLGSWWLVDIHVRGIEPTKSFAPLILLGHVGYTLLTLVIYGVAHAIVQLAKTLTGKNGPGLPRGEHDSSPIELYPF